ncbi:hypothetical protein CYMTET_24719 [Cymbomonas tetramitiformis]|uniref:Polycystin cation channel PKD1/PKD2 domain-containing protein n=1 Tax=Cymbomonas tetramitiformis TaxID=36881 RepID=A0AAE0FW14_9CHLO|nr:hypothetical protein CYMTET_24719 [Cymbomonas tetramitiformis]
MSEINPFTDEINHGSRYSVSQEILEDTNPVTNDFIDASRHSVSNEILEESSGAESKINSRVETVRDAEAAMPCAYGCQSARKVSNFRNNSEIQECVYSASDLPPQESYCRNAPKEVGILRHQLGLPHAHSAGNTFHSPGGCPEAQTLRRAVSPLPSRYPPPLPPRPRRCFSEDLNQRERSSLSNFGEVGARPPPADSVTPAGRSASGRRTRTSSFLGVLSDSVRRQTRTLRVPLVRKKWSVELFIHFSLAVVILMNIMVLAGEHMDYIREAQDGLSTALQPETCKEIVLFKRLLECIRHTQTNFVKLVDEGLSPYDLTGLWPDPDTILQFTVETFDDGGQVLNNSAPMHSMATTTRTYNVTKANMPFAGLNLSNTGHYGYVSMNLHMQFNDLNFYNGQRVCIKWDWRISFDVLATSGILKPDAKWKVENCEPGPSHDSWYSVTNRMVAVLSLCSLLLTLHSLAAVRHRFWRGIQAQWRRMLRCCGPSGGNPSLMHTKLLEPTLSNETVLEAASSLDSTVPLLEPTFSDYTVISTSSREPGFSDGSSRHHGDFKTHGVHASDERDLQTPLLGREAPASNIDIEWHSSIRPIQTWWLLCGTGNVIQLAMALHYIFTGRPTGDSIYMMLLGIGNFLGWVNVVRYLDIGNQEFYKLVLTVERATPEILRCMASSMPIFIGFALMGIAIFSTEVDMFGNMLSTCRTLFALMNGDTVLDALVATDSVPYIGLLYTVTFMLFFMYIVMNIFVTTVLHTYHHIRDEPSKHFSRTM